MGRERKWGGKGEGRRGRGVRGRKRGRQTDMRPLSMTGNITAAQGVGEGEREKWAEREKWEERENGKGKGREEGVGE